MNNRGLTTLLAAGTVAGLGLLAGGLTLIGDHHAGLSQPAHADAHHADQPAAAHAAPHAAPHAPHHADDGLDAAVKEIYGVISGPAGQARDWDHFKALFTEDAVMGQCVKGQDGTPRYVGFTPAQYVERNAKVLEDGGFFEQEIGREVRRFGQMAHVWSTYQARRTEDGEVFMRGINSIQMVDLGEAGWKVRSIFWNPETPTNPLPEGAGEAHGEAGGH